MRSELFRGFKEPLNNSLGSLRGLKRTAARRVALEMVVPFSSDTTQQMCASGPALRGFQAGPHSALWFFDRPTHAFKTTP